MEEGGLVDLRDDEALATARRTFRDSGMLVLPDVFDVGRVAALRSAYDELLRAELGHDTSGGNSSDRVQPTDGRKHVQMQLPLVPPFSDVETVAHPLLVKVLTGILGENFHCSYYNSNTAFPGSTYQRVHRDAGPVFGADLGVPTPTTAVVVNIPLCDFTRENGSTEVWPASHLIVDSADDADVDLTTRAQALASARMDVPAGSVVVRDLRLWHRGVPNESGDARSMLAVVYQRSWLSWRAHSLRVPAATWRAWPDHVRSIFSAAPVDAEDGASVMS
ncbi:phytanoyl-CoA dioxygenase family protein [Actinopolymorpha rutila]|uniref:Ectoine hydroxylase-related dioxygenase (Phytanoyl-CoA dioxygenase family) n=1 Tax=Actinopolymorpha rutila TaxID=446787 RepID=A0A852ZNI7_9ACTN|nr:phytanoyl-CoA dioxygenase family protein [Actinopolymorpha rutila]NYH93112.1 ectoine hydroxylase-related dioxygenase (phytanoyl-CoA dioxygenase family) [Actinopolymorpha rutila]